MRLLHRMAKQDRERKGPGLAPHIPMPSGATGTTAEIEPGLSPADLAALEQAARTMASTGPAARSRGRNLAADIRGHGGSLTEWLPVLHRLEWAQRHGGTGSSWAHVVATLMVACHELHTGDAAATREPPPQAEDCGCRWLMPRTPGDDPAWVPCDGHGQPLRAVRDGEPGE